MFRVGSYFLPRPLPSGMNNFEFDRLTVFFFFSFFLSP